MALVAERFFFFIFKDRLWLLLLQPCSVAIWLLHKLVHQSVLQYGLAARLGQRVSEVLLQVGTNVSDTDNMKVLFPPSPLVPKG